MTEIPKSLHQDAHTRVAALTQKPPDRSPAVTRQHPGLDHQPATHTHCPRCLQPVIQALTDGIPITANPQPLDLTNEIRAHLNRRTTYELHTRASGHVDLIPRTASRIRHQPAATVLADHRCAQPAVHWRQAVKLPPPILLTVRAGLPDAGDTPPF